VFHSRAFGFLSHQPITHRWRCDPFGNRIDLALYVLSRRVDLARDVITVPAVYFMQPGALGAVLDNQLCYASLPIALSAVCDSGCTDGL